MLHVDVGPLLEERTPSMLEDLRDIVRFRSVSSEGHADLDRMAEWLVDRLGSVMTTVERVTVPGAPDAVVGRSAGRGSETVLLYSHYDVQPAAPEASWTHPPFAGEVSDGRMFGRGIVDDKADIVARLHALQIWREVRGDLPANLVWLSEGAEEIGSPGLAEAVRRELVDDGITACVWESYLRTEEGLPELVFGCRGLVYVELSLDILASDQHSSFASISRSATGEMARALAGLTDETGVCLIDGFLEGLEPFTPEDLALIEAVSVPTLEAASINGVDPYLAAGSPSELRRRFGTVPTCNVDGFWGGYTGAGMQTVVAGSARAKLDFRILPGQNPDGVVAALRRHLDLHGHTDIRIATLASVPAFRSSLDFPVARMVHQAAEDLMGSVTVRPLVPGTGPLHAVEVLDAPVVLPPGAFRMSSMVHAPNENVRLEDFLDAVRFNLRLLELLDEPGHAAL